MGGKRKLEKREMTEGGGDSSTAMVDVLDLAKNAISISGLKDAQYSAENEAQIRSFLSSTEQSTLVAMIENGELVLLESIPSNFSSTEFVYLLKSPETEITAENFHNKLQSGSILGKFIILKFHVGH